MTHSNLPSQTRFRSALFCILLLSGGTGFFLSLGSAAAQEEEEGCSKAGFFRIACLPGFRVERKTYSTHIKEIKLISSNGDYVQLQALPFASFPDGKGNLASVIQTYKVALVKAIGRSPQEKWIDHHGAKVYQLLFPPGLGVWFGATQGGYTAISAKWTGESPILKLLDILRVDGREIDETIQPPAPAESPQPAAGGSYFCKSQGTVKHCSRYRSGRVTCTTQTVFAGGVGKSLSSAQTAAIIKCRQYALQRYITGNYPSGSSEYSNFGQYGAPCAVTTCDPVRD